MAFDTTDHEILCKNLQYYGFRGIINVWFKSHLTNRTQFVYIDGCRSSEDAISYGVPQGSMLGRILFFIYK